MKALTHCTVLYTRDAAHYPAFRDRIADLGGIALHLPLMATRVQPLTAAERAILDHSDTLVFTSAAAVRHLRGDRRRATATAGHYRARTAQQRSAACPLAPPRDAHRPHRRSRRTPVSRRNPQPKQYRSHPLSLQPLQPDRVLAGGAAAAGHHHHCQPANPR